MAMADIAINIVTKGAELAKRQLGGIGDKGSKSGKQLGKFSNAVKLAGLALAVGLAKGLSKAVQEFTAFDDKMVQSLAIMDTTVKQQKAMENMALQVSRSTRIGAEQSAEAYFFLASAGLNAEQSISALPQVAKFAQAGMFDMATATDLATDAQSALGLTVEGAEQNLANLTRVTDVLVKANTLANASVQQFSEALTTKAGAALKVVNKDVEEGVAVLAAFADRGVKGAEAGDKLNQVLRDIPRATAKNSEEFAALGLNMFDTQGNMKNVADIVEELDRVLGPMSDEMKAATLDQLGLNRGVADAVKILSGAGDQIREYEKQLRNAGGATSEVAEKQMNSLKAQTDLMKNSFSELGIIIGSFFAPALTAIVKGITTFTNKISDALKAMKEFFTASEDVVELSEQMYHGVELAGSEYNKYSHRIHEATERTYDYRSATDQAIDSTRGQEHALRNAIPTYMQATDVAVAKANAHREEKKEMELAMEVEAERIRNINANALSAFNKLLTAQQNLNDIYEEQKDLLKDMNKAEQSVAKAKGQLENANDFVTEAQFGHIKAMEESKKVTAEEELAIIRQTQAIAKLSEEQDGSRQKELELAIAKERLEEITKASTSATAEEISARRLLEQALEEQKRAEEDLLQAQERLTEATEDYNKATADTPENIMKIALAKQELDKAMEDAKSLGTFEELLKAMVDKTGKQLDRLRGQFFALWNGEMPSNATGGGGYTPPNAPGESFGIEGDEKPDPTPIVRDHNANALAIGNRSAGVTTILNIENSFDIQNPDPDAVAVAVLEAQKRGIKVIL